MASIENKLSCVSIFWEFFKLQELHRSNIHSLIDTPALPQFSYHLHLIRTANNVLDAGIT